MHKPAIDALAKLGLFENTLCGGGAFCPDEAIKRSTMAVWLVRAVDGAEPPAADTSRFTDVDKSNWQAAHFERLAELGITQGCATDPLQYCPNQPVTRAQMATFLVRAFSLDAADARGFTDTAGNFHQADIDALAAANITAGCSTNPLQYCPNNNVTRGQMATFLARALGHVPTPTPSTTAYTDIAVGSEYACALRTDGTVDCWGEQTEFSASSTSWRSELSQQVEIGAPDGSYQGLAFGGPWPCSVMALRSDGGLECWHLEHTSVYDEDEEVWRWEIQLVRQDDLDDAPEDAFTAPEGVFTLVDGACGIRVDGTIACWGEQITSGVPQGTFKSVSAARDGACAIRTDGTIACWGKEQITSGVPQGTFKSVSAASENQWGSGGACAIRSGGAIACWGDEQVASDIPTGTFESVAGGSPHACAIRTDSTIACWGHGFLRDNASRFDPPQGTFTAIDIGPFENGEYFGAVRSDGTVALWGTRVEIECCG